MGTRYPCTRDQQLRVSRWWVVGYHVAEVVPLGPVRRSWQSFGNADESLSRVNFCWFVLYVSHCFTLFHIVSHCFTFVHGFRMFPPLFQVWIDPTFDDVLRKVRYTLRYVATICLLCKTCNPTTRRLYTVGPRWLLFRPGWLWQVTADDERPNIPVQPQCITRMAHRLFQILSCSLLSNDCSFFKSCWMCFAFSCQV